jgi:cytochrome c553
VTLIAVLGAVRAAAEPVPFEDSLEQRMKACVVCHGEKGAGVANAAFPRLAGQPAEYLASQMKAFRDGRRTYAPMNFLMARQADAYLDEIATWLAAQKPDPNVVEMRRRLPTDPVALATGEALVRNGRPAAGLPACAACHGPTLNGTLPGIPALAGMPRDFLIEQVGSWKTGSHRSPEPNCMAQIAGRMTGADIVAAATWLALQQPDGTPQKRSGPLPLACGSE